MATFDAKKYRDTVLKPHSRGEGYEQLREVLAELHRDPGSGGYAKLDLGMLFGVPSPVSEPELKEWRTKIEPALNRAQQLPAAKLLKQLLDVLSTQGKPLTEPSFWGGLQADKHKLQLAALDTGMQQLRSEYPLDVVALDELKARLATIGISSVTDGSIASVATQHGLNIQPSFTLPTEGIPPAIQPVWKETSQFTEFRSMAEVVLMHRPEDLRDVTFIERLGTPLGPITTADIEHARLKSEQGRDTNALQNAQKLLGAMKAACPSDSALHAVILSSLAELATAHLGRGRPQLAVRDHLHAIGFDRVDASRLVAALGASSGAAAGPKLGLNDVRELVSRGELGEAERMLSALESDSEEAADHASLTEQIAQLRVKKQQAVSEYHTALSARDFTAASAAMATAISIDQGDATLPPLRDALPPAAPVSFQAREQGPTVQLTWTPSPGGEVSYTVVRSLDRAPATVGDGDRVAAGVAALTYTDSAPSIGSRSFYAVFATRDGTLFSDGTTAEVTVLPPPTALASVSAETSAQLTWSNPSGAAGTSITQTMPDGTRIEHEVHQGSTLQITGLTSGATYRFAAHSWYLLDSGRQLSAPVSISVVPRGAASTVTDLEVAADPAGGGERLIATWTPSAGFEVELWRFPRNAALPEGTLTDGAALTAVQGVRLNLGGVRATGTRASGRLPELHEVVRIAPVTITDDGYLVGYSQVTGNAPRATQIVTEAFGDELGVSWEWPEGDYIIELGWHDGERQRTRRVTKARYRSDGGAKLAGAASIAALTIATVVRVDGDEWVSTPATVPLSEPRAAHAATYRMSIKRALFGGKITCHITATADATGFTIPADIVLKRGAVMPFDATDGTVQAHIDLDFRESTTFEHTIQLAKEASPFWVCVFPRDGSLLDPPPTSELKG